MRRRRVWLWLLALGAVGGLAWFWFGWFEPLRDHLRWYRRVGQDIEQLAHRRPPNVTKGQWEFVVGWTINLHGNCGADPGGVDPAWRDGFAAEFERRLAGPLTVADIEWVWDEYARHTRHGQRYSDQYRPTRAEEFPQVQEGCFGFRVD